MKRSAIVILLLAASIAAASAFGLGEGNRFGRLGSIGGSGTVTPPPTGCASTGILDLSNTCNDIYFIGALK